MRQLTNDGECRSILGQTVLRSQVVIFDVGNQRLYFAAESQCQ